MSKAKILIVGKFPDESERLDGMMIRVMEIDRILSAKYDLTYLDINFRNKSLKIDEVDGRRVIRLNPIYSIFHIYLLLKKYELIYVHSLINFVKLIPQITIGGHSYLIDIHGAVVEESLSSKSYAKFITFMLFEKVAFKRSLRLLAVSHAMADFYANKYGIGRGKIIVLPIFGELIEESMALRERSEKITIIYAGGDQAWQNFDMMLKIAQANNTNGIRYEFFMPKKTAEKYKKFESGNIKFSTASSSELLENYSRSHFGFLLREENTVNRIATPTKFIEYVSSGVVPIVIQPKIGDMSYYGYRYLTVDDLAVGRMPFAESIAELRGHNYNCYLAQRYDANNGIEQLHQFISDFYAREAL